MRNSRSIIEVLLILFFIGVGICSRAQIIPPGLGETNNGSWIAIGVTQDLKKSNPKGWQSISYFGLGRTSNPDNYNPLYRPGIIILNQEFKKGFHKNWESILAFSYRRQDEYSDQAPYEKSLPALKQEFRLYGRLSYIFKAGFADITPTFRQEIQKYYTPDFNHYPESFRIRSRFRLKVALPLSKSKVHRLSLYSEQLFSTSKASDSKGWSPFKYADSRFSVYYSLSPKSTPLTFNMGYMNNLIRTHSTHYLGLDVIWKNPFSKKKRIVLSKIKTVVL